MSATCIACILLAAVRGRGCVGKSPDRRNAANVVEEGIDFMKCRVLASDDEISAE